jgi:acyl-CoA hydrolase
VAGLAPKRPSESRTELAELMMPQHANILGKVFGGTILAMLDKAAAAASIRHCGRVCVTAHFDQVTFHGPIEIGELVRIVGTVNATGRTSMEVGVQVFAMNMRTGESRPTNTCYVTMVAIDEQGRPVPVPPLLVETDEERRLEVEAQARMAARKLARSRTS